MTKVVSAAHPARWSEPVLEVIRPLIVYRYPILDPFAGVSVLADVNMDIEPEWATNLVADATQLPFADETFEAIVTSPCYGNRMADHHNARDGSRRITYRHILGRELHHCNAGQMQWGQAYKDLHVAAWREARRVLQFGGLLILNVSDHIRAGKRVEVSAWHKSILVWLGLRWVQTVQVPTPRMRFGVNSALRVDHEDVHLFEKKGG